MADISADILIRAADGRVIGAFPTSEKLAFPWTDAEASRELFIIIRKEMGAGELCDFRGNHYKLAGPRGGRLECRTAEGNLHGNMYADGVFELLPESEWSDIIEGE